MTTEGPYYWIREGIQRVHCNGDKYAADEMQKELDALAARLAELESDDKRMTWLIQNGERIFGSLWREASKRDIDAAMQAPDSAAPQPHDNSGNVSVQANLASRLTSHPMLSPTHRCRVCGAFWRQCDDFSMNLRSAVCCDACNNAPCGHQLRPLAIADQPTAYCRYCGVPDGDGHTADCQHPSLASQPSVAPDDGFPRFYQCRTGCIDDKPHQWDGPEWVSEDGCGVSATCSRCGMTAMHHSLMTSE